jgi:hypothetical protein
MTEAMKKHYKENFSDWFEPGSQLNNNSSTNNSNNSLQTRYKRNKPECMKLFSTT